MQFLIIIIQRFTHCYGWLVVFYVPLTVRSFRDGTPFTVLAKDVKFCFNTFPTGNRTPGHRVAVHYTTAAPRQLLHILIQTINLPLTSMVSFMAISTRSMWCLFHNFSYWLKLAILRKI